MNSEQVLFLEVLKCFIHKDKINSVLEINWERLKDYSDIHQVTAIVYFMLQEFIPEKMSVQWKKQFASQIYSAVSRETLCSNFDNILKGNRYVYLKGVEIANLYPVKELRSMGDIDVLIPNNEKTEICMKLEAAGFQHFQDWDSVSIFFKNSFEYEIHTSLVHKSLGDEKAKQYFSNVWNYVNDNKLDWNYHYIFLLQHLKGHMISAGVGFRQFMDIAIVTKCCSLDWNWIKKELKKIGLYKFWLNVLAFNQRWFNVDPPINGVTVDDEFYYEATEKIFLDGVFGKDNEDNEFNSVSRIQEYENVSFGRAKWKNFLLKAFPDYNTMSKLPYCKYLTYSKLLLPISWIHRFGYRVKDKRHRSLFIKGTLSDKCIKPRSILLSKWGL